MSSELHPLRTLHLFAGAGGGILGDLLLGHRPICAVEIEPYCQQVLSARQKDGFLPWFPIYNDVATFDGKPWRGLVDVVSGGFPCQDISAAGKGAGITGERSGMWKEMARIIGEVRPRYVLVENSPVLTSRGLGVVLGDLAEMGYDAEWGVYGAGDFGDCHQRERIWVLAYDPDRIGREKGEPVQPLLAAQEERWTAFVAWHTSGATGLDGATRYVTPHIGGADDVFPARMDRFKAAGNAQHCGVVRLAWHTLHERIKHQNT